jgi:hypothetical protein
MRPFSQERSKGSSPRLNSGTTGDRFNSSPVNEEETSTESCAVPDHDPGSPVMSQQPQDKLNKKQKSSNSDSAGQTPTPSLSKQMSTRDFINSQREERLNYHAQVSTLKKPHWFFEYWPTIPLYALRPRRPSAHDV